MKIVKDFRIISTTILVISILIASTVIVQVSAPQPPTPSPDLGTYVIFALNRFSFKGGNEAAGVWGHVLGGNVGVNNDNGDPNDNEVSVGANGRFDMSEGTQLTGYQMRLGIEATVYDVFRNGSDAEAGSGWPPAINPETGELVVRGTVYNFTPPIIPGVDTIDDFAAELGCEKGDFTASTNPDDDRTVVDRPSRVDLPVKILTGSFLPPGTYRDLQVQNGGTLHLGAGVYTFRRFNTGRTNLFIYTVPGTIIQITGDTDSNSLDFDLGPGFYFGSEDPAIKSVACICYLGDNMQFGTGTAGGEFWGVIKAPYADLNLGHSNEHHGRFYANSIGSDFNVNVDAEDCTPASGEFATVSGLKTATGHYGATYDWTIEKTVTPEDWNMFEGDTGTSQYTITVTKSEATSTSAHVEGTITVKNEGAIPTEGLAIFDKIYDDSPTPTLMGSATVDVSPMPVLAAGESYDYHYIVYFDDPTKADTITTYTNKATITINNGLTEVASTAFTLTPIENNDDTIHVEDSNIPDDDPGSHTTPWEFPSDSNSVTYEKLFRCEDEGVNLNTATIQETGQSSIASVNVVCYQLEVTKDATTSFTRTNTWEISKSVMPETWDLFKGDSGTSEYTITVSKTGYIDSDWKVEGTITIHNPATIPAEITDVSDSVQGIGASITDPPKYPYTLEAGVDLIVHYTADLSDADLRTNTATATLQNYEYDSEGVGTESGTTDFTGTATVSFAEATINEVDECITVTDDYAGGPQGEKVCYGVDTLPKIFTYTRTIGPYEKPGKYTVENCASFVTNDNEYTGEDCAEVNVEVPLKFFADAGTLSEDYTVELNSPTSSEVIGLYSGPQVWWKITYYVKNTYDSGYYFTLWDKWGGNLMALGSQPTQFVIADNELTLADNSVFIIDYDGYEEYIGPDGKNLSPSPEDGNALITLHTGDQQQGTNPGGKENAKGKSGKGTQSDGKSYDVDIAWEIGWLAPTEEATLTIYVAPGLNPAGKLEFTSEGCTYINTGPVLRAWDSIELQKKNFEFAESFSNTLEVCVEDLD